MIVTTCIIYNPVEDYLQSCPKEQFPLADKFVNNFEQLVDSIMNQLLQNTSANAFFETQKLCPTIQYKKEAVVLWLRSYCTYNYISP